MGQVHTITRPEFILSPFTLQDIAAAIEEAKRHVIPLTDVRAAPQVTGPVYTLKDRPPGFVASPSQRVTIPPHYRLQISIEEQAPGMCIHISLSCDGERAKHALPGVAVAVAVAQACGIPIVVNPDGKAQPDDRLSGWVEEFLDGQGKFGGHALCLIYVTKPTAPGHA